MRAAVIWIIALFAVFSWVACWQEWQIVRLRREVEAQAAAGDDSRSQVGELGQKLREAERRQGEAEARLADLGRRNAAGPDLTELVARDADFAAAWRKDVRRLVLNRYGAALAGLSLPAGTLEKLSNLLIARSEAPLDAQEAAEKEGVADGSQEMGEAIAAATGEVNRDIAGLLGPGEYRRFVELTSPAGDPNGLPAQIGTRFANAGLPLSAAQASSLAQIDAGANDPAGPPAEALPIAVPPADAAAGLTVTDEVVILQAGQVLSPAQLGVLRQDRISRHRKGGEGGAPAAPAPVAPAPAPPAAPGAREMVREQ